jgi:hypothetical protein
MASFSLEEELSRRIKAAGKYRNTKRIEPGGKPLTVNHQPYFWGRDKSQKPPFRRIELGYAEARKVNLDETPEKFERILKYSLKTLSNVFDAVEHPDAQSKNAVVTIALSPELQTWREQQHVAGYKLPSKGHGIARAPAEVVKLFHAEDWPEPLLTNCALFISGFYNLLVGAHDPETLYSNYCIDMGFFYEHGYEKAFPEYEPMLKQASNDPRALRTLGGLERRVAADISLKYIRGKIAFEEKYKDRVAHKTARLSRQEALILNFCECSGWGMAAEALARNFDKAGVLNDFAAGSPAHDFVDVGSDIHNSELFNSFLNTADICDSGIVSEENLRKVYNAYAHSMAKMFTDRWSEPGARLCSLLLPWHIVNGRHEFLRRIVLGYPKARKTSGVQQEGDFDEVFDADLRTTGLSRPLSGACNGAETCDHVEQRLRRHNNGNGSDLLMRLWWLLSTGPLQYAAEGAVNPEKEDQLADELRIAMAKAYSLGLVEQLAWLVAHASQHAWQVNYLCEAAMFGSLLDDGGLKGKLDRRED